MNYYQARFEEGLRERRQELERELTGLQPLEVNTLEEIEDQILNGHDIRLERTLRDRDESGLTFLKNFLTDYNLNRDTIYIEPRAVQTVKGKRRSINDIYKIFNYYYPEIPFRTFVKYLHVDLPQMMNGFRSSMCSMINKRVYYYDGRRSGIFNKSRKDQFNRTWYEWTEEA